MTIKEETLFTNEETVNSKQLAVLKKHFPQCFDKQGKFIQEKMLEVVQASDTELSQESYGLNWLGKSYAQLLTNLPPETLISADTDHNQKELNKNSNNLLIKGDNLEVLKHMVNAYSEKIKMIYIDPPYNTGSDGFVYNDNRKFTKQQLSELAGIDENEAERILTFTDKGSNSHSAWLTFIYPRLYIARELLREDGVIFISIDDNEVSQLKMLCDEVFGEQNMLCQFTWRTDGNFDNQAKIKINHEYILCYSKNIDLFEFSDLVDPNVNESSKLFKSKIINTVVKNGIKNPISKICLPIGFKANFDEGIINKRFNSYPYFHNDAIVKNGVLTNEVVIESGWSSKRNIELYLGNNLKSTIDTKGQLTDYWLTKNGAIECIKKRAIQNHVLSVLMNMGNTQSMGYQLNKEFSIPFPYPKPLSLIRHLISVIFDKDILILDFFAGSGTTAHSVMQLNAEDGGNRQCISVQLDEATDKNSEAFKAEYKTIFDITKARISKAGKKIQQENPEYKGDLGFKIYQTVEDFRDINDNEMVADCNNSNNINGMPKKITPLPFIDDKKLTKSQYQALLTTWCLYDGALLTTRIDNITLEDYQAHLCDNRLYLLATGFSTEALKALLLKLDEDHSFAPHKIIFYGNNFESATQRELNEAVTSYANKKSLAIELVVRY